MRYFISIIPDPAYEAGKAVPQGIMDAMGPYIEKQVASGTLISTAGLSNTRNGTRLEGRTGKITSTDGPFSEAKEVIGGYAVVEVPDKEAALTVAREFVQMHIDNGMPDIAVEVRPIAGGHNF